MTKQRGSMFQAKKGMGARFFTMDSAVLGLASPLMVNVQGMGARFLDRFLLELEDCDWGSRF
jgi:hypothetical protein